MKQQELQEYMQEIIKQCHALKIPVSRKIQSEIVINERAKCRFGACKKTSEGFVIEISELLLKADPNKIKNVIAHELLHTCYGCYNHGERWKSYAIRLNEAYGYNIKRTNSYEEMGMERPEKKLENKYMIQCQKCGKIFYRQKKSKLVTQIDHYRCRCGGILKCYVNQKKTELP